MSGTSQLALAIETSNPSAAEEGGGAAGAALGRVAGGRVAEVLGVEWLRGRAAAGGPARGGQDDDLMPAIDRLFKSAGARPADLRGGLVAVSVGPGGYTGLRVACAVGKMIAEGAGARCAAVPTARVVAARTPREAWDAGAVAVALASKGDSVWVQVLRGPGLESGPGELIGERDVEGLVARGVRTLVADRFLPRAVRRVCEGMGVGVVPPVLDPVACLEAAMGVPAIDPVELVPLYPREPDAVTLWRARRGGAG